jgi:hypothetical protein
MTEHAVALVYAPSDSLRDGTERVTDSAAPSRRRVSRARRLRPSRPYVLLPLALLVSIWLVLVFGRTLTDLNAATERAAAVGAESAALEARLEAGRREVELVRSDAFMAMQARTYGMGLPGERAFALAPGAPPAPSITPLGAATAPASPSTPLESWLGLLFGGD